MASNGELAQSSSALPVLTKVGPPSMLTMSLMMMQVRGDSAVGRHRALRRGAVPDAGRPPVGARPRLGRRSAGAIMTYSRVSAYGRPIDPNTVDCRSSCGDCLSGFALPQLLFTGFGTGGDGSALHHPIQSGISLRRLPGPGGATWASTPWATTTTTPTSCSCCASSGRPAEVRAWSHLPHVDHFAFGTAAIVSRPHQSTASLANMPADPAQCIDSLFAQ